MDYSHGLIAEVSNAETCQGAIEPRLLTDGSRAFDAKIRSDRALTGHEPEWTMERAERFPNTTLVPAAQALDEYVKRRRAKSINEHARNAAESPVTKHLLPFFAFVDAGQQIERPLGEVDEALPAALYCEIV